MGFLDRFRKKKQTPAPENQEAAAVHCFVLCLAAAPPDLGSASRIVTEVFGPGHAAEVSPENIVVVSRGADTVGFLAHMPAPIPGGEAEQNADGNFLWPDGREEVAAHRAHVLVTHGSTGETPVQRTLALSRLALVALRLFDGMGVYWGPASVCHSRALFEDLCATMSEEQLPVPVWLRFQLLSPSADEIGLYTLGMNQFNLMDLEVDRCRMPVGDLFEFVSNIAHYLIVSGPVIADGNTVGGSEEERILVHHRPSMVDGNRQVYKIVFEG